MSLYELNDVLEWAGVIPLIIAFVLVRQIEREDMLVALAFFALFFATRFDWVLHDGSNWWIHLVYPPVQLGFIMAAIMPHAKAPQLAAHAIVTLGVLAALGAYWSRPTQPELVVEVGVYAYSCLLILPRPGWRYRKGLLFYFGLTLPFLLIQGFAGPTNGGDNSVFITAYYGEQAARVIGAVLVSRALWHRREERPLKAWA